MKSEIKRYEQLKEDIAELNTEFTKAQDRKEQAMKALKKEFGIGSLEQAEKKAKELGKLINKNEKEFKKLVDTIEKELKELADHD